MNGKMTYYTAFLTDPFFTTILRLEMHTSIPQGTISAVIISFKRKGKQREQNNIHANELTAGI